MIMLDAEEEGLLIISLSLSVQPDQAVFYGVLFA